MLVQIIMHILAAIFQVFYFGTPGCGEAKWSGALSAFSAYALALYFTTVNQYGVE